MSINKVLFDSGHTNTDLCQYGKKFETDKSPYNEGKWRHGYTPFYDMIFSSLRYNQIVLGEIGIWKNSSIKMWREYFSQAKIYAWDNEEELLEDAKNEKLHDVFYDFMNVHDENDINFRLEKTKTNFDIIIDDSSHDFWDQIRIIRASYKYLKPGGYLIIEDIDNWRDETLYYNELVLYDHLKYFSHVSFIETNHKNKMTYPYDNDKLLFLIRNNI
jgi:SAM-dependent methyltransferase